MAQEGPIGGEPAFYVFVAATALLSLGYQWGKRRNEHIVRAVLGPIVDAMEPEDQQFTNIGGVTGYHAALTPQPGTAIQRVDITITLLPRQAWLYLPFSLLMRQRDRLVLSFAMAERAFSDVGEAHFIVPGHARSLTSRIANAQSLSKERFEWSGREFIFYHGGDRGEAKLRDLRARMQGPGPLHHVAIVPEAGRVHVSMAPRPESVGECFRTLYAWACEW